MEREKTIMNSHEAYINLLRMDVKTYSMSELESLEKRTRNSNAYRETNAVYNEEILSRKSQLNKKFG